MFKLYKLNDNRFKIVSEHFTIEGNKNFIKDELLDRMEIDEFEIEAGIESLVNNNHDVADYGCSHTFIFSKKLNESKVLPVLKEVVFETSLLQ